MFGAVVQDDSPQVGYTNVPLGRVNPCRSNRRTAGAINHCCTVSYMPGSFLCTQLERHPRHEPGSVGFRLYSFMIIRESQSVTVGILDFSIS